jgi:chromate reductase, NAD(P)H dehydrogenase (quinone)
MTEPYIIISGTNRKGSNSMRVSLAYQRLLEESNVKSELLTLEDVDVSNKNPAFQQIEKDLLIPAEKFIFIAPEYNGSIPGVLKSMLDISDYKKVWWGKKALLAGVSTGRSGNVRGMEHLTSILHYLKVVVHPNKVPISSVEKLISPEGELEDSDTLRTIRVQLSEFIRF